MTVGIVRPDRDVGRFDRPDQGAAQEAEREIAQQGARSCSPAKARLDATPFDFADPLAEGCVRQAEKPGDLRPSVTGDDQQGCRAQGLWKRGDEFVGALRGSFAHCDHLDGVCGFPPTPSASRARLVQGAIAQHPAEPATVLAAGHIPALSLERREQGDLKQILRLALPTRSPVRIAKQVEIGLSVHPALPAFRYASPRSAADVRLFYQNAKAQPCERLATSSL